MRSNNTIYVNWDNQRIKLTWIPSKQVPDVNKVTSVHSICFSEEKILLVHVKNRGFNIPGGHVEANETPEVALQREVMEEGCVRGEKLHLLGMIEVSHEENDRFEPDGKYPLIGYQLFYRMDITECLPFSRRNETVTRIWVEPSEIPYVTNDHELLSLIVEEALSTEVKQ